MNSIPSKFIVISFILYLIYMLAQKFLFLHGPTEQLRTFKGQQAQLLQICIEQRETAGNDLLAECEQVLVSNEFYFDLKNNICFDVKPNVKACFGDLDLIRLTETMTKNLQDVTDFNAWLDTLKVKTSYE